MTIAERTDLARRLDELCDPLPFHDRPLFILTAYTSEVPYELPDGTPGFAAAARLIGSLALTCFDRLSQP